MADLLQYGTDVSSTKLKGGHFGCQCPFVNALMDLVNPHFESKHWVTWCRVAHGTMHWLKTHMMYSEDENEKLKHQMWWRVEQKNLEQATEDLWEELKEMERTALKCAQDREDADDDLPPERKEAQYLCQE